jgi:predicted flap endonuclease-1-like 5' DNA nuclease
MRIEEIEGIGPAYGAKLAELGVATSEALLERGASAAGRAGLAESSGISGTLILEWVNHVDLMRIDGVGSEYSDLLEAAGVDSPPELAQRNAANLAITLQEVVAARPGIVRRIPSEAEVAGWIAQARTLPKVVTHGGSAGDGAGAADPAAAAVAESAAPSQADHSGHDHAGHDHDHDDAGHDHDHAADSAPAVAPAATPTRALAGTAESASDGWWARIKRLFGG